jgi:hypothetical protein
MAFVLIPYDLYLFHIFDNFFHRFVSFLFQKCCIFYHIFIRPNSVDIYGPYAITQ